VRKTMFPLRLPSKNARVNPSDAAGGASFDENQEGARSRPRITDDDGLSRVVAGGGQMVAMEMDGEDADGIVTEMTASLPPSPPVSPSKRRTSLGAFFNRLGDGELNDLPIDRGVPDVPYFSEAYPPIPHDQFVYKGDVWRGKPNAEDRMYTEWSFYPFFVSDEDLCLILRRLFERAEVVKEFNIPMKKLDALILRVHGLMYQQPFHNFRHVVDVVQATWMLSMQPSTKDTLGAKGRLELLLAALMHDVDHPGFSGEYLAKEGHFLVNRYGDEGTLEQHHATIAQNLLDDADTNVLAFVPSSEARESMKQNVLAIIRATDFGGQDAFLVAGNEMLSKADKGAVTQLNTETSADSNSPPCSTRPGTSEGVRQQRSSLSPMKRKQTSGAAARPPPVEVARKRRASLQALVQDGKNTLMLMKLIIKAADISHYARPALVNERWASRLWSEQHRQAEYEKTRDHVISASMNPEESVAMLHNTAGRE